MRDSREALLGLADLMESESPVSAAGVARLRDLLTDGAGPLYYAGAGRSLASCIWSVADGLSG